MLVPYSKYQVVARPFGSTVPASAADVAVTLEAAPVTATGPDEVLKMPSSPRLVAAPFVATRR